MNKENVWGKNLERCVDKFTPQGVEVFICTFLAFFSVVASSPNPQVSEYNENLFKFRKLIIPLASRSLRSKLYKNLFKKLDELPGWRSLLIIFLFNFLIILRPQADHVEQPKLVLFIHCRA